jgi:pimeloyl-[acyl-carrier protein] methyl ester esterase
MLWHNTIGSGPDLVLLHGWGFSSDIFETLVDKYKNQYRITLIDLPGHGRSDDVNGGINEWCNTIAELVPNNANVLGSSLGGLLAMKIASICRIKNLIVVGATPSLTCNDNWQYGMEVETFMKFADDLKQNYAKTLRRFVSLQTKDKTLMRRIFEIIDKYPPSSSALTQGLSILLETDYQELFKSLDIPKYTILGTLDMLVPRSIEPWYQANGAQTTLMRTGHLPFLESEFSLPENV